jgi:phosphoenolpyruvate synthase/pyruvate phosphate dikinase
MFKYKGVNLIKTVYRPYVPLISSLFIKGFSNKKSWREFTGLDYQLRDLLEIDGVYYYPDYHLSGFSGEVVKRIFSSKEHFLRLKKVTLAKEKKLLLKNQEKNLRDFFKDFLAYQPALAIYHICDDLIEDKVRSALLEKVSAQEADRLMSLLNLPVKPNLDYLMKRWFLKSKNVDRFIKKYSWTFSRYGEHRFLNYQEALGLLAEWSQDKSLSGVDKNRAATKKAIFRAKKILQKKAYYVDIMQFFIYYRTHRTDIMNKVFFSYYDRLVLFAHQIGLSHEELLLCSYDELVSRKIPSKKILQARKAGSVVCFSRGETTIVTGARINYFRKLCLQKEKLDAIGGRVAFPGIISGVVRVIKNRSDFHKFKNKEILVSSMTTPSMVPIMKKAAAFVTDEGGITCHAAILAREMKKPCIIGTKVATKALKDGDFVEVDADKGVVKIIK